MKAEITTELRSAFKTDLADVCKNFVLTRSVRSVDIKTDTSIDTTVAINGYGAFLAPNKQEMDMLKLSLNSQKILFIQDDFDGKPMIGDIIDGTLRIDQVKEDPSHAIWKIFVRAYNGVE